MAYVASSLASQRSEVVLLREGGRPGFVTGGTLLSSRIVCELEKTDVSECILNCSLFFSALLRGLFVVFWINNCCKKCEVLGVLKIAKLCG